jgi:hypothetical protein
MIMGKVLVMRSLLNLATDFMHGDSPTTNIGLTTVGLWIGRMHTSSQNQM